MTKRNQPNADLQRFLELSTISNRITKVSLVRGVLEQTRTYLESAATSTLALGSKHRYQEAWGVYQQVQEKWPNEQRVKELAELFHYYDR